MKQGYFNLSLEFIQPMDEIIFSYDGMEIRGLLTHISLRSFKVQLILDDFVDVVFEEWSPTIPLLGLIRRANGDRGFEGEYGIYSIRVLLLKLHQEVQIVKANKQNLINRYKNYIKEFQKGEDGIKNVDSERITKAELKANLKNGTMTNYEYQLKLKKLNKIQSEIDSEIILLKSKLWLKYFDEIFNQNFIELNSHTRIISILGQIN